MRLKKINYPTLSQVTCFSSPISYNLFALMQVAYGGEVVDGCSAKRRIQVLDMQASPFTLGICKEYDMTEEGYEQAKKEFETLTLKGIESIVDTWIDKE